MSDRITATYRVETPLSIEQAAEVLAGEQSSGTFVPLPGESPALRERFRARVEQVQRLDSADFPSLATPASIDAPVERGEIRVSWALHNVGANLPALLAMIQGNLYELREFSGIKLLDLDLPAAFVSSCPGPQFGVDGTRQLAAVADGPIIGTIIKPSVGLTPTQTAEMARDLANAGIDFIKDDELIANPPYSPLAKRVDAVMAVLRRHADATGKRVMFAFNITDAAGEMQRHHDLVVAAGGSCLMIGLNNVGLSATQHLRGYSQLPIHGHRNGWGMLSRHPLLGLDFSPYQKIWRCAGVDQIHVNGLGNKFAESDESVIRSIKACLRPLHASPPAMPVISSGQWGGQAPATYDACSTTDLMYLAGGGILAHPGGMAAGVAAIRQAWEAAVLGIGLADYAVEHRQLAQSIAKFGPVP